MSGVYTVIIERDEDGFFVGSVPALPGCHMQARSFDLLMGRVAEAIALWLEAEADEPSSLELVGVQRLAV